MITPNDLFTEETTFSNLGYWRHNPPTLDAACRALAQLLGEAAHFQPGDHILDLGFGYADQDLFWLAHFSPAQIAGLNVSATQVATVHKRPEIQAQRDKLDLRVGSATAAPFAAGSFDKVVALESALHFDTRQDFFREAYRLLRPGGRLATADVIPMPNQTSTIFTWLLDYQQRTMLQIPKANLYHRYVYARHLQAAGFEQVRVISIRDYVFEPFSRYVAKRLQEPDVIARIHPFWRQCWQATLQQEWTGMDYIIAVADKPMATHTRAIA